MLPRRLARLPRAQKPLLTTSTTTTTTTRTPFSVRHASSTTASTEHKASEDHGHHDSHESHYDAPGGWLWGLRPGEKYEKEGWENVFYFGFVGSWVVAIAAYTMKEDTSIQTWALEEARRRLEKEGILEDTNK